MLTVKALLRGEDKYWARKPSNELSSLEILSWHMASDLADLVEMTIGAEDLQRTWPETWTSLWGMQAYWKEIGQLPPQSVALVLLVAERLNYRLSPRGDDTKAPPKAT